MDKEISDISEDGWIKELGQQLQAGSSRWPTIAQSARNIQWPFKTFNGIGIVGKIFTPNEGCSVVNTGQLGGAGKCFTVFSIFTALFRQAL